VTGKSGSTLGGSRFYVDHNLQTCSRWALLRVDGRGDTGTELDGLARYSTALDGLVRHGTGQSQVRRVPKGRY